MQSMDSNPVHQSVPQNQFAQPYWPQQVPQYNDAFTISLNPVAQQTEKNPKKSKKSRKRDRQVQEQVSLDYANTITLLGQGQILPVQQPDTSILQIQVGQYDQPMDGYIDPYVDDKIDRPEAKQVPNFNQVQIGIEPVILNNVPLFNNQIAPQMGTYIPEIMQFQPQFMESNPHLQKNEVKIEPQLNSEFQYMQPPVADTFIQINIPQSQPMMMPSFISGDMIGIPVKPDIQKEKKLNLTKLYIVKNRSLAFQLDPDLCRYQGQITFDLHLSEELLKVKIIDKLDKYKLQGFTKIHLEAKFMCKQAQIVNAFLLDQTGECLKKKPLSLLETGLNKPEDQATIQQHIFGQQSRNVYQFEQTVRSEFVKSLKTGTSQLSKKIFSVKLRRAQDLSKYKAKYTLLVSFFCDQITDVGGLRAIRYMLDREAKLNSKAKTGTYFFTNDHCGQSEAWLPKLLTKQTYSTPWSLKFIVPKEYMIIASGKQLLREVDQEGFALHEYELNQEDQTTPDKIGFIALPFPEITPIELQKSASKLYACFVSRTKQQNLNPKLVPEIIDYIGSILMKPYPCKETQLVFVPNLFPHKHAQQSLNFAGGLHILDQDILFKSNQIDKRHHTYKHLTSALTFDYFGNAVRERLPSDAWLIVAIRERLGDRYKKRRCGTLLYRYHTMRNIEKMYKQIKQGLATTTLQRSNTQAKEDEPDEVYRLGCPHPAEQSLNDIFYRKCGLVMHMVESNIDESNLDKIFREMYHDALLIQEPNERLIDHYSFRKKFRKVCGMKPDNLFTNWIWSNSCPKLELSYEFNKRNNSLDLQLKQTSAVSYNLKARKNLEAKLNKIFGVSGSMLEKELNGEVPSGLDTFIVDELQSQRRWFVGDINIVIYQVEGSGGDILKQQHKMQLKDFKTIVSAHIPLQGRVKRTMPTKKKEFDMLPFAELEQTQQQAVSSSNLHMQAAQMVLNNDVWKFEMNEFELEDFPQETKNIFTTRELENNPVLWIRVDPDMEFIRQVKVVQDKKVHWLFQLLRENDIVGQIEAVKQLHKYNSELVYEILKTVAKNENYFFKVRKCVLKALQKMEVSQINKWLSHEAYLLRVFNKKKYDEGVGFYKANNFTNLLEYYFDRSILKAISKCKEDKLKLRADKDLELKELRKQRDKIDVSMEDATDNPKIESEIASATIQLNIVDNQLINVKTRPQKKPKLIDESLYRVTTDAVAKMLIKVLEQNDNSENPFDDSFLIRDLLSALGNLDNINLMPKIAAEIYRQFKLDQISNSSPLHSITCGAIQGYFNMQKQIWRFRELKLPNIDPKDKLFTDQHQALAQTEQVLSGFSKEINSLMADPDQSLNLRLFIFCRQIRNLIFCRNLPLVKALQAILDAIFNLQAKLQIRFAYFCLQELALFLEGQKFVGKLNFTELFIDSACSRRLMDTLWSFICLPHCYLSQEISYWTKRIIHRVFGQILPDFLRRPDPTSGAYVPQFDYIWSNTEQKLAQEEQLRQTQKDQMKPAQGFVCLPEEIVVENIPFESKSFAKRVGLRSQLNEIIVQTTDELQTPEERLQYMMAREPGYQQMQPDFYQRDSLGRFVINVGDNAVPVNGYQDGLITLQAVNPRKQRERYNSDLFEDGNDSAMYPEDNQSKESANLIEISKDSEYGDQDDDNESVYDPFAEQKFEDPVVQACWLILGELYYHYDATDFLEPVSAKTIGYELYDEYVQVIKHPMDIGTVMRKMQTRAYRGDMSQFIADVELIFDNCREFNEQGTEIYNCANILTEFFKMQLLQKGLIS